MPTKEIMQLYRNHGHRAYGEGISQLSHAVQSGYLAKAQGYDQELILAAFLHDIGHFAPHFLAEGKYEPMGDLGSMHHDQLGETFLRELGASERLLAGVRWHVAAKRYLCVAEPGYYDQLSAASKATLTYQGGPFTQAEAKVFANHPYFGEILELRRIDEAAKDPNWEVTEDQLAYFEQLLSTYFTKKYE